MEQEHDGELHLQTLILCAQSDDKETGTEGTASELLVFFRNPLFKVNII